MTLFAFSIPDVLYQIYGYAVPVVILAVLYGLRWKAGMWSNCLSLGAVLFSILIAVGGWENLAYFLASQIPQMLFFADCVAIWALFLITLAILDLVLRYMSAVKVKYADPIEQSGNGIVLFLLFLALYGFFLFAEELGPVGEHANVDPPGDTITIQMFRFLSAGNLAGFTEVRQFDDKDIGEGKSNFRALHVKRRQALMYNMMTGEGAIQGLQGDEAQVAKMKRRTD